ncbi:MAG: hypothetical protein J7L08_04310 [Candidatus Aenigmarchaeota archaeon]|nr:hypothetical protein [Candidatus Aenigmarchaeota archaeon]
MAEKIGKITHFFDKINVAVVELSGTLREGDKIRIKGATTDFEQTVDSMQVEHEKINEAKKGSSIGLKVTEKVRPGDEVFLAEE